MKRKLNVIETEVDYQIFAKSIFSNKLLGTISKVEFDKEGKPKTNIQTRYVPYIQAFWVAAREISKGNISWVQGRKFRIL